MASSPYYSPGRASNFNEDISDEEEECSYLSGRSSDEDTEDASETDVAKLEEEFTVMKETMYQEKLAQLKKQLQNLQDGSHSELNKKLKKLEQNYKDRIRVAEASKMYELEFVEREYIKEKKACIKEFEAKKIELKENLIAELEEKKRAIEILPHLNFLLSEDDILEDLKVLNKKILKSLKNMVHSQGKAVTTRRSNHHDSSGNHCSSGNNSHHIYECRIDDGKLFYDKRWYHRGQPVYYENKEGNKVSGVISSVGQSEIWIRKTSDNAKVRIYVTQFQKGKYSIKRRST
ncbi:sin3 histone deacetylase corepressor complex component SDS3-like [Saccoglossus kowalevskii]|uniref:Sin3 histone deacetylase corepressor complex component SDS3-like n=1 Tax=Saccoglossus kowalevskii TaxID=10224 RepID=A0ABM0GRX3_SACKO|nr:PREDICTED: sin3 histone deacetylase corepressor complex component SDS3-like [Saccoglossus kowalevskii]